ncbi:MAG: hypothetical protein BGO33_09240 [Bacteroidia bacterium 43-41]|nr:MAG: hypothetical protein BGO33_09240 [Bacteroidia bacterium 43-41]
MKRILFLMLSFLLLYACNENTNCVTEDVRTREIVEVRAMNAEAFFSFDSVTNPVVWRTFQSLEEMQVACQVPEDILESMSTDNLIQTCMNYPLYGNYLAYNNELEGIKFIINGFNGFAELQNREDAADRLIAYYEGIDVRKIAENAITLSATKNELSVLHIGYLELILSSRLVPSLYAEPNISRLEKARYKKYEDKLQNSEVYSLQVIKKSLLLGAQIKLKSKEINNEEKSLLSRFVEMGGEVNTLEDYTKVSQIINK